MAKDLIKTLKFENPATGGTQLDIFPTEANPAQDYVNAKGFAFESSESKTIDTDASGNIQFTDLVETTPISVRKLRTAVNNIFDNTTNGFSSTNVQSAIEEARDNAVIVSYTSESVTPFTTSSRTNFVVITGMTITPAAGTYVVLYNASSFYTTTPKAHYWSIFVAGVEDIHSTRSQDTAHSSQNMSDSTNTIVTVNGSQAVDVRVKCDNTGTLTVNARNLILLKIG